MSKATRTSSQTIPTTRKACMVVFAVWLTAVCLLHVQTGQQVGNEQRVVASMNNHQLHRDENIDGDVVSTSTASTTTTRTRQRRKTIEQGVKESDPRQPTTPASPNINNGFNTATNVNIGVAHNQGGGASGAKKNKFKVETRNDVSMSTKESIIDAQQQFKSKAEHESESSLIHYTTPDDPEWPTDDTWQSELASKLSPNAILFNQLDFIESSDSKYSSWEQYYSQTCYVDRGSTKNGKKNIGAVGYDFIEDYRGLCMIDEDCIYEYCDRTSIDGTATKSGGNGGSPSHQPYNTPAYTLKVITLDDIIHAVKFANKYNIPVSVKLTGHNFAGQSILRNSLNIWMIHYRGNETDTEGKPKVGVINNNFQNSCQQKLPQQEQQQRQSGDSITTIGIGGGFVNNDVFKALGEAGDKYHIISGDTRSVGFAGWLLGVGLSHTARHYGLGVDQVQRIELVLANGTHTFADECTNPELFWALKGGGGGTYGVVTYMDYKLHDVVPLTNIRFTILNHTKFPEKVRAYIKYWINVTPNMDTRVGGSFFKSKGFELHVLGDINVAYELFLDDFETYLSSKNVNMTVGMDYTLKVEEYSSWFEFLGGSDGYEKDRISNSLNGDGHGPKASTRTVPHDLLIQDPQYIEDLLMDLAFKKAEEVVYDPIAGKNKTKRYNGLGGFGAYWLGGKVRELGYTNHAGPSHADDIETTTIRVNYDKFRYQNDIFKQTNNPEYASGERLAMDAAFNHERYDFKVQIGGIDKRRITTGMSGGYAYDFGLETDVGAMYVELDYRIELSSQYESDEFGEVMVGLDDVDRVVATISGKNGNIIPHGGYNVSGMFTKSATSHRVVFPNVPKGQHTIYIGGYNNQKTASDEFIRVKFRNIRIMSVAANMGTFSSRVRNATTTKSYSTSIHPMLRDNIFAITTTSTRGAKYQLEKLPNTFSSCSFNHHGPTEPEWRKCLWSEMHYDRLLQIKKDVDPQHRFNCWHCVGYQGNEI